ncbi:hypothetical protein V500_01653, partial [Pseudogymnoascus sp. VKM F-4518 (FW-2643)]
AEDDVRAIERSMFEPSQCADLSPGLSSHHQIDDASAHRRSRTKSFRLTTDMQTRAKNETTRHVRPSAGQLQPSTPYPPDPISTDDDKSTTMAPCLRTTSGTLLV